MTQTIRGGEYYSVAEAANELGVSEQSVYDYISDGRLAGERINRSIMILKEDLMSFKSTFKKWEKPR